MPRSANPFYYQQDGQLGSTIGALIGRAMFGDPELQAQAQLRRAQMDNYSASAEEARAHAGLYGSQQTGVDQQNTAGASLPELIKGIVSTPPAPPPAALPAGVSPDDPLLPLPEAAPQPTLNMGGLPALIAATMQMQGDKVEPGKAVAALTALFGDDSQARRGMVAQGITPGKEFALTPERADDIAQAGYNADYRKGTAEASINHASDIPVANIQARSAANVATINHSHDLEVANINHSNDVPVAEINNGAGRTGGWTPRFSAGGNNSDQAVDGKLAAMQQRLGVSPDQHIDKSNLPAVFDAIASTEGANPANGNPGNIVDGPFARSQPGYVGSDGHGFARFSNVAAGRNAGIALLNVYYNRGQQNVRDIIEGKPLPGKPGAPKAPAQISAADSKMLDDEITRQIGGRGWKQKPDDGTLSRIREAAQSVFQRTGNPAAAVSAVLDEVKKRFDAQQAGGDERQKALDAIAKGAPKEKIAQLYKQRTGRSL